MQTLRSITFFNDCDLFEIKGILMVLVALLKIKAFFDYVGGFFMVEVIFMINVTF